MSDVDTVPPVYLLGDYCLNVACYELSHGEEALHLEPKPFQILVYLVEHRFRVVSRDELLTRFWGEYVSPYVLNRCISQIRKVLPSRAIKTVRSIGYRYAGPFARGAYAV